jgi:hypothetical protein
MDERTAARVKALRGQLEADRAVVVLDVSTAPRELVETYELRRYRLMTPVPYRSEDGVILSVTVAVTRYRGSYLPADGDEAVYEARGVLHPRDGRKRDREIHLPADLARAILDNEGVPR